MTPTYVRAVLCLALAWALAVPASSTPKDASHIVAIGDVHGGSDSLVTILESAGLIDSEKRWTGGTTTFVQTGDLEGIHTRFEGRVFLVDTSMVSGPAAGGLPAALELKNGQQIAIYEDSATNISTPPETGSSTTEREEAAPDKMAWLGADDKPLPFETPEEVAEFLRTAEIVSIEDIPLGVTKPKKLLLVQGDLRSKAVFRYVSIIEDKKRFADGKFEMYFRDHFMNEVAAYELSRLLGLDNLPPAVERTIDQEPGSVQMWVENAMMETERNEKKLKPPDRTHFNRQFFDMKIFDNLINNIDRNSGNILIDANWKVWMIDHTRSFARAKALPTPKDVLGCSRKLFASLQDLDKDELTERMRPYLSTPEIKAVLERRKRLVKLIEERIAKHGEDWFLFNYGEPNTRVRVTYEPE